MSVLSKRDEAAGATYMGARFEFVTVALMILFDVL